VSRWSDARVSLEITDVTSGYGDLRVLRGVSLSLREGTIEAVLGRNGVGKTTLLSTVTGLVPTWDGRVTLDGADITRKPAYARARDGLGLVQEGKRVFHGLTVFENLMVGCFHRKLNQRDRRAECAALIEQFPLLQGREEQRAGSLSGGQQQMLSIAQALAGKPTVLLLDEPSAGLAPAVVDAVFNRVAELRDSGLTILLVEQLAERALAIADHVTVMDNGEIIRDGLPADFADRRRLEEAYFGVKGESEPRPLTPPGPEPVAERTVQPLAEPTVESS
jgi:branched-chain amino acid transport system ATP-binding protein